MTNSAAGNAHSYYNAPAFFPYVAVVLFVEMKGGMLALYELIHLRTYLRYIYEKLHCFTLVLIFTVHVVQ